MPLSAFEIVRQVTKNGSGVRWRRVAVVVATVARVTKSMKKHWKNDEGAFGRPCEIVRQVAKNWIPSVGVGWHRRSSRVDRVGPRRNH